MWICKRNHQRKIRETSKKLPPGGRSWPLIGHGLKWYMAVASSHPPKFVEDQVRRDLVGRNGVIVVHGEQQRKLHGIAMDMMRAEKLNLMNSHFLADMQMVMVGALSTLQENHVIVAINLMVNQLLGVSTESEIGEMARLFSDFVDGCLSVPINLPGFTYCTAMRVTSARPEKLDLSNMQTLRENGVLGRLVEEENLPDDVVSDFIINLLFAGNETTAKTMLFALYFLTHCPDALEQVQVGALSTCKASSFHSPNLASTNPCLLLRSMPSSACVTIHDVLSSPYTPTVSNVVSVMLISDFCVVEQDEQMGIKRRRGSDVLSREDYEAMPFTLCVIDETLRLGGIAIWLLREAKVDIEYQDLSIPKGFFVVPFLSAVHRDESIYPEALSFYPWRWMDQENKVCGLPSSPPLFLKGKEVREYTNLNRKWGKGKDKIDDEDITYSVLITCPGRDIGFSCWAVDASRCRKLLVNVEATFMGEGVLAFPFSNDIMCLYDIANFIVVCFQLWTVMTCYI
ncbi:hypothetical protein BHM03_00032281 [Ensete ventricosum]|nr:hypothetical protein BHM03_00032281 [Ensete ventricosum]